MVKFFGASKLNMKKIYRIKIKRLNLYQNNIKGKFLIDEKFKYTSNSDILIILSIESTLLSTKTFSIFLQMIDYEDLFYYFLDMGRKLP